MTMKKSTLIKLHLYCGLFTSFYLIAFGFSSIVLNHKIDLDHKSVAGTWTEKVAVDTSLQNKDLSEKVRNQLGLMGWIPYWQFRRDSVHFQFNVTHLAKTNKVKVDLRNGKTEISDIPKGFWATLHGLHFFNGRIPNAPFFLKTWMVYQWLALLVLLISLILGLWLWIAYSHRTWEIYVFGGLFFLTILIMILL